MSINFRLVNLRGTQGAAWAKYALNKLPQMMDCVNSFVRENISSFFYLRKGNGDLKHSLFNKTINVRNLELKSLVGDSLGFSLIFVFYLQTYTF